MMLFRPSRDHRGPDPFLNAKIILFVVGTTLALVGVASDREILIGIGGLVIAVGVALRFVGRR